VVELSPNPLIEIKLKSSNRLNNVITASSLEKNLFSGAQLTALDNF
jgi:hypothetical protein